MEKLLSDRGVESMKSKVFMPVVIFGLFSVLNAAAEERKIAGEVSLRAEHLKIEGEKAKFNEYRDIQDGFTGDVEFQYEREKYYLDFSAAEAGRKDQSYELSGGKWGSFKYDFRFDQLPHNFTDDARSFYSGIGGANLTYPTHPPSTDFNTWNTFDYSVERKNYAGGFKFDLFKPFHFNVSAARETRNGLYPIGVAGTTPGGIAIELPSPVDYTTDSFKVDAGYNKNPLSLSLSLVYGTFDNGNSNLNFRNPATDNTAATTDSYTLPPDNEYYNLNFQGAMKLPWNSKFNVDLSNSRVKSDAQLSNSYVADVTGATSNIGVQGRTGITLSDSTFDGKVDKHSYNFLLTSNPLYFLDSKLFYKYYKYDNKSDEITTTDSTASPTTFANQLFGYRKQKAGAELGFRLPASFYLSGAYNWVETMRDREDIPKNNDNVYSADLRWSGVDFMLAKVGYERLNRKAEFEAPQGLAATDAKNIETYVRRYDAAAKDRDTYKAVLEFFPIADLNFSFGYRHKYTNYKDTILGLQDDKREEFTVDADYMIAKRVKLYGYFDFEYAKVDQKQRTFTSGTTSDPSLSPTSTNFNWTVTETDRNYAYSLGSDVYAIPKKLTLKFQYTFIKSRGFADYTYLLGLNALPGTRSQDNIDNETLDNYTLQYFLAKATYNPIKPLSLSLGWAYEKFIYDDAQFSGYQYVPLSSTGGTLGFLTGAYANQSYRANIYFATASYLF
jgi:MtrB/PioB family decaheme-associated outer membrane protein